MLFFTPVSLRERRSFDEVFLSFFMFPRQSHVFKCKTGRVYFHVSRLTQWLSMDFKELFRPFAVAEPNVFEDLHNVREVTEIGIPASG